MNKSILNLRKFHYISFFIIVLISALSFILSYVFKVNGISKCYLNLFSSVIILFLIIEVIIVILKLYDYLFKKVFSSPAEHSDRLITELRNEYNINDDTSDLDKKVDNILKHDSFTRILKKNTISTILYFLLYAGRFIIVFAFSIFSLVCLNSMSDSTKSIFNCILVVDNNYIEIIEKAIYFSLVTSTTIGYGDIFPQCFFARLLIDTQIISSIIIIIFGGNFLIGSLMENTALAWNNKKIFLKEHIQRGLNQRNSL